MLVVVPKVTDSNDISERFCNGADWCMASTPAHASKTRRHAEWNMSANWCQPPFHLCGTSVCSVYVCVFVLYLAHFILVTHLISLTFDAECKRDTYWHIIRPEQCVLLQLITVSALHCCAAKFSKIAVCSFNYVIDLVCVSKIFCVQYLKVIVWDSVPWFSASSFVIFHDFSCIHDVQVVPSLPVIDSRIMVDSKLELMHLTGNSANFTYWSVCTGLGECYCICGGNLWLQRKLHVIW